MSELTSSELIVSSADPLQRIAEAFQDLGRRLALGNADPLASIPSCAVVHVPGVDWASITVATSQGGFRTAAATDDRARAADQVQYDLGSGPCVDAATEGTIYCPQDIEHDERWPDFGKRVAAEFGVGSMLAFRLALDGGELLGALNLYATAPHAFDDRSIMVGELIAAHAASRVGLVLAKTSNEQLTGALASNRDIGVAMGVLMQRHKLTREQAFDLLRLASQNSNRKLRDIAVEVGDVGELLPLRRP